MNNKDIVMNKKKIKNILRYIWLVVLMFISAINYNLFLNPNSIISGGGNGLSILILFSFLISIVAPYLLLFNIILYYHNFTFFSIVY